jgi:predicted peptidase
MRLMTSACLAAVLMSGAAEAGNVANDSFKGQVVTNFEMRYAIFLPEGYDKAGNETEYPLILFLHGAGERGDNLDKITNMGVMRYARNHTGFHFIVVAPQCPLGSYWKPDELIALLDGVQKKYRVQKSAVYVTGYSMGGAGTWAVAMDYPERFAAIAPVSGRAIPLMSGNLWKTPVWAFHGDKDDVVPFSHSDEMVGILKGRGNKDVKFTVYKDRGHDIWDDAYGSSDLYSWLMQHRKDSAAAKDK